MMARVVINLLFVVWTSVLLQTPEKVFLE